MGGNTETRSETYTRKGKNFQKLPIVKLLKMKLKF